MQFLLVLGELILIVVSFIDAQGKFAYLLKKIYKKLTRPIMAGPNLPGLAHF